MTQHDPAAHLAGRVAYADKLAAYCREEYPTLRRGGSASRLSTVRTEIDNYRSSSRPRCDHRGYKLTASCPMCP